MQSIINQTSLVGVLEKSDRLTGKALTSQFHSLKEQANVLPE